MSTALDILTDALTEIGVLQASETPEAGDAQLALRYFQRQLDAWRADRLTLSTLLRTPFTLLPGTSSVSIGTPGGDVPIDRPTSLSAVNYVIPGTNPEVESPIAMLDEDSYAAVTIKALPSALPTQCFYATRVSGILADLFFWPQVTQVVKGYLYAPQAVGVPVTLTTVIVAPAGYAEAFHYQLALRLCRPFGVLLTPDLMQLATTALATMKRPNVRPGVLGMDPALAPTTGGGYNVFSDTGAG